jgi:hypothetical protein
MKNILAEYYKGRKYETKVNIKKIAENVSNLTLDVLRGGLDYNNLSTNEKKDLMIKVFGNPKDQFKISNDMQKAIQLGTKQLKKYGNNSTK